ncbi:MAG TPA: hypothetical protein VK631_15610 [Solirubrobacteraceae bacterium]|nr:hypothetical protein [Solirubrobacteraceae bacterium]
MPKNQRLTLLGLALVTAVVAIVLIGSAGGDSEPSTPAAVVESPTPAATATPADDTAPEPTATPKPRPPVPTLSAENPRRLKVKQGDTVRFAVASDVDEDVHVHGYDKSKDVKGGSKAVISFKADITGIFEIELEHSGTPVGELEVRP